MRLYQRLLIRLRTKRLFQHAFLFQLATIIPPDLQAKINAKASELEAQGFPKGLVQIGKKQAVDTALGLALTFGRGDPNAEQTIIKNSIDRAVEPDGTFESFVKGLSRAIGR